MNAIDTLLGKPGDQPRCKVIAPDISVHWFPTSTEGESCFCGATTYHPLDEE